MNHPPIYYTTRKVVRTVVWGGLGLGLLVGLVKLTSDDRPSCDVTIISPQEWRSNGTAPVDVSKCVAPAYMVLHQDGTWDWVTDK